MDSRNDATRRLLGIVSHLKTFDDKISTTLESQACSNQESPLEAERRNASFTIRDMTYVIDGGKNITDIKEMVLSVIQGDPILYNSEENMYDFTRPQARARAMEKVKKVLEYWSTEGGKDRAKEVPRSGKKSQDPKKDFADAFWWALSLYDRSWATRIGVHYGLFINAIQGQGTPEQQSKYLEDAFKMKILGCFAMTELGHGSYIRGFETTSTYDKKTQEFVINSPTDTSTKFWIGMAGQTATHSVVYARLLIDEKDYGIHTFVVPLRDIETGVPLPGIEVGDCGAKMGRNGLDNGWIQFKQVRVPRENMLMKWSKVSADGQYTSPPKSQLSYGTLIGGRVSMIRDASDFVKVALTIAIRYSAVRKQFPNAKGDQEEQILNYQTHQYKLMPLLATCYAYHFTSTFINKMHEKVTEDLEKKDISSLPGLHGTSAGLKAFATWWANEAIEQCRQSLGGHGYSAYSGMSSLLADWAVNCTWEGDNTVLAQQTARYLMKCLRHLNRGKPIHGFETYLLDAKQVLQIAKFQGTKEDLLKPEAHFDIMKRLTTRILARVGTRLVQAQKEKGKTDGWNECMMDLIFAAKVHCDFYTVHCFAETVKNIPESNNGIKRVLQKLYTLRALWTLDSYFGHLLEDGFMDGTHTEFIRTEIRKLCLELRKDAVPLVDSFNFPDFVINSPLGRYDGQVYSNYLEMVKKAPNAIGVPSYFNDFVKPLTSKQQ